MLFNIHCKPGESAGMVFQKILWLHVCLNLLVCKHSNQNMWVAYLGVWCRGYKTFPMLNQPSTKFTLLINVKMPTIVGILTFISMINTTSERLKSRNFFIRRNFSFYEQLKFRAQLS